MPFGNPVVGGTILVRPAIKSPNFLTGVSGWQIAKDGSAEFNNIVIRGSTTTQGTILIYNGTPAAGNLVGSIAASAGTDAFGNAYSAGLNFGNQQAAHFGVDRLGNVYIVNASNQNVIEIQPNKQAMWFYTGVPATGNLNVAIAAAAGTDNNTNTFTKGITLLNGGTATAKDASGNTAILTSSIPGGGTLSAGTGLVMQPIRNTGDPATIGSLDPGGALPVSMALLMTSPSATVGGLPATDFSQISMTGLYGGLGPEISIDANLVTINAGAEFDANGVVTLLQAHNRVSGTVTITPSAANTPTSQAVVFPTPLTGSSFSCQVTAGSAVPGTQVTGVSYNGLTSAGVTIWVTRTNTTATVLSYTAEGF